MRLRPAAPLVLLLVLATAPPAGAVVPPKDCGTATHAGKRYQIKVHRISCATGRKHVKRLAVDKRKPGGYRCQTYRAQKNRVRWSCDDAGKAFFAILR